MNSKHHRTRAAIFSDPIRANIEWKDIESLLENLAGAPAVEGRGSRVSFTINGVTASFHRPHPQKETDRGAVKSVRKFLEDVDAAQDKGPNEGELPQEERP